MTVVVEGLYIFDDNNNCILEHIFTSRPPTAQELITRFNNVQPPRPAVIHIPDLLPPATVFSLRFSNLLLLCTSSKEAPPLAILEFLYRVIDAFEDFLGSPLLSSKIEENYEVVAQILGEMCDGGIVCNTETNALKESVEVSTLMNKLLTHVGLPGSSPAALGPSSISSNYRSPLNQTNGPAIPWRRSNVRHTSNELYVDIVESLSVILAPSGRFISARIAGSILFTAKISGIPDLLLTLSAPGNISSAKALGITRTMQLPVFHPCVRLSRWKDNPGELSFVPPDGRFMLAGYETDLLPSSLDSDVPPNQSEKIFLPATVDMKTSLGSTGLDFEARLTLNNSFPGSTTAAKSSGGARTASNNTPFSFGAGSSGSSTSPIIENLVVTIPLPMHVRSVTELKTSRGEADFNASTKTVEWRVPTKDGSSINGVATLTGTIAGPFNPGDEQQDDLDAAETGRTKTLAGYYDNESVAMVESHLSENEAHHTNDKKSQVNKGLMPGSIAVSFNVKGWLPSGIRVDSLLIDTKKSKGLGDGVKPYKGVKYLTVSRQGIERRI